MKASQVLKYTFFGVLALVFLTVLSFGFEFGSVKWQGFIRPMWADVERETFERTQAFAHGKILQCSNYYREYQEGDPAEQAAIRSLVRLEFNTFDADLIDNPTVRTWLIQQRGF